MASQGFESARRTITGQFKLPTTGSSGGILLGTDVLLYRGAAHRLYLGAADSILIQGDSKVYFRDTGIYLYSDADSRLTITADGYLTISAPAIYIDELIYHEGDNNTYIRFLDDEIRLVTSGARNMVADATGIGFYGVGSTAQAAHLADPTNEATLITAVSTIIDELKAYGLMAADP